MNARARESGPSSPCARPPNDRRMSPGPRRKIRATLPSTRRCSLSAGTRLRSWTSTCRSSRQAPDDRLARRPGRRGAPRPDRAGVPWTHAHRDLERQLAEGPARARSSGWLVRARPDVLLMQETKLADADVPADAFRDAGYELAHHGEGRWNGVAIASRGGIADVVTNFGEPLRAARTEDVGDDEPLAEARMISASCGGVRVSSASTRPTAGRSARIFYDAKLVWFDRLARWLAAAEKPDEPLVLGGDLNVAPADIDVWDPRACHGGTHVSEPERKAFAPLCELGVRRRLPAAASRARALHVVGLSRRQLPQELRDAHRPPPGVPAGGDPRRVERDRPRDAQGQADAFRPHAARDRPRRAGASVRRRLGRPPRGASPRGAPR